MQAETLLLRQIHPSFVQDGRPTSQAFRPTVKDEFKLSLYRGDMIQPEPSWTHYTTVLGKQSVGVMGISFAECSGEQLPVVHDGDPFPEHCFVDFNALSTAEIKEKSQRLAALARSRDWLFRAS